MFITFEGGDGVGKTTQSRLLYDYLTAKGIVCQLIREPGGTPLSERIREIFIAEERDSRTDLLLILAARRENLEKIIKPALARGETVIADRFIDSTLVYQGIAGELGLEYVAKVMQLVAVNFKPDLTFVLDVAPQKATGRIKNRHSDRFDRREDEYHRTVRDGFVTLARDARHVLVNAEDPKQVVHARIISEISALNIF